VRKLTLGEKNFWKGVGGNRRRTQGSSYEGSQCYININYQGKEYKHFKGKKVTGVQKQTCVQGGAVKSKGAAKTPSCAHRRERDRGEEQKKTVGGQK